MTSADDSSEGHSDDRTLVTGGIGAGWTTIKAGRAGNRLSLLVISDQLIETRPLPASGEVVIGRAPEVDITINDPSISRSHARLMIGPGLTLEDLGSSNGTLVRDQALAAGDSVAVAPGDVFQLGNATLIVQTFEPAPGPTQRIRPHDYFESRLEEECARRDNTPFAVARIHCDPKPPDHLVIQAWIGSCRASDIIAQYSPSELECLLVGIGPADAQVAIARVGATLERAGIAVRLGLSSYPRDGKNAFQLIRRASPYPGRRRGETEMAVDRAVQADRRMHDLYQLAERIAAGNIAVLILGETGVGKEVLAERVHKMSPRASKPYLKLNCAALSETLLESELFGHERGAFTGAVSTKPGLLETAEGGTVFLDEVGEMPLSTQVKLLRVLEERKVLRVGGLQPRTLDVRFIAATNRDLEGEIVRGTFRQDLFYRLNGVTLVIPPLRERTSEIPDLIQAFAAQAARGLNLPEPPAMTPEAMERLLSYGWPGNIRELRNVVERAVLLCGDGPIDEEHLPLERMNAAPRPPRPQPIAHNGAGAPAARLPARPAGQAPRNQTPGQPAENSERQRILEALAASGGNQTEAAKKLGIARRTLINKLDRYGISGPRKKRKR